MPHEQTRVTTPDGVMPVHVFTPDGAGPWPAVIFYMDAGGIRPGLLGMAERIAGEGFVVLLPDLFYRYGPYGPFVPREVFAGDFRAILGPLVATTDNLKAAADTAALLDLLDQRRDVAGSKVGVTGYCMGGGMAMAVAGSYPDRVAAVASFHGGRLATDEATSPHLLASAIKAEVYVAAAENDATYPPEMAARFEAALAAAGVNYSAETYAGCRHGWTKPDFPVYDAAGADRAHGELVGLLRRNLPA
jgi:carboxymethylenebutenolidase